jgi:nicotinate-nucleotide adenylyltransferase
MIKIFEEFNNKINVALLGGAFDPIHRGHIEIAKVVLNKGGFDEVWLIPNYFHLHKKNMAPSEDRLNMCQIAVSKYQRIKVFDYDIRNKLEGETYYSMEKLLNDPEYKSYNFSFVIGQDNANTMYKWFKYEELINMIPFVVISRTGIERDETVDWYLKPPHKFIDVVFVGISSTEIKQMLREKDSDARRYLDRDVISYIKRNKLYQ